MDPPCTRSIPEHAIRGLASSHEQQRLGDASRLDGMPWPHNPVQASSGACHFAPATWLRGRRTPPAPDSRHRRFGCCCWGTHCHLDYCCCCCCHHRAQHSCQPPPPHRARQWAAHQRRRRTRPVRCWVPGARHSHLFSGTLLEQAWPSHLRATFSSNAFLGLLPSSSAEIQEPSATTQGAAIGPRPRRSCACSGWTLHLVSCGQRSRPYPPPHHLRRARPRPRRQRAHRKWVRLGSSWGMGER
mmetsp:Transcript_58472/g.124028  ORF Transcript_58472/g.124028 Transcript_58472/m.124028 type:complete len:243 (+) Transcript_58472:1326-2054(+)